MWNVKVDSCKASELVDSYSKVKSSAGLASLLGAKWWPVGVTAGVFTAWAWANQETVKKCASNGTGISFKEASGIVVNCTPQWGIHEEEYKTNSILYRTTNVNDNRHNSSEKRNYIRQYIILCNFSTCSILHASGTLLFTQEKFKEIEIHFCRFNEFLQSESLSCSLANPPDEGKVCRKGRGIWCRHDLESDHDGVFNSRNRVTTVPDNRDSGHRIRHVPRMIILDDVRKPLPPRRLDVPGTTPAPWCLRGPDRPVHPG